MIRPLSVRRAPLALTSAAALALALLVLPGSSTSPAVASEPGSSTLTVPSGTGQ